jgi:uncharacterized protein YgbK (DUF1537 family)
VDFTVVVPAFPKNGRVTKDGYHYISGERLERSDLARDPVHPMRDSFLPRILRAQTNRTVGLIRYCALPRLAQVVASAKCQMAIVDAARQEHLATIAAAVHGLPLVCGSGGLAAELAKLLPPRKARPGPRTRSAGLSAALMVSGSVTDATAAQIEVARRAGIRDASVDVVAALGTRSDRMKEVARVAGECLDALRQGRHALLHLPTGPDAAGRRPHPARDAPRLAEFLAEAAASVLLRRRLTVNRLVLVGGDTAAAVCRRLGVVALDLAGEIQPGVASAFTVGEVRLAVALKPGSFGDRRCLLETVHYLGRM